MARPRRGSCKRARRASRIRRRGSRRRGADMTSDLSGRVALVTGAARGIGQAIADRFAANGATVYYTDLILTEARAAAQKTPNGRALKLDVTNPTDVAEAVRQIVAESGRLDVLVNNAGVNTMAHRVTIDQFPRDEWDRI